MCSAHCSGIAWHSRVEMDLNGSGSSSNGGGGGGMEMVVGSGCVIPAKQLFRQGQVCGVSVAPALHSLQVKDSRCQLSVSYEAVRAFCGL